MVVEEEEHKVQHQQESHHQSALAVIDWSAVAAILDEEKTQQSTNQFTYVYRQYDY